MEVVTSEFGVSLVYLALASGYISLLLWFLGEIV